MRYVTQLLLFTGICFCVNGCTIEGGNRRGPHHISDNLKAWECYLADPGAKVQDVWYIKDGVLISET